MAEFTLTLSDQEGNPTPEHPHPVIQQAGTASVPAMVINNDTNRAGVMLYVRAFQNETAYTDATSTLAMGSTNTIAEVDGAIKLWVGFAYVDAYDSSAEYFSEHPVDASGMHHTVEIPQ
ncbi:MAG TPA: hypothetical protein VGG72_23740 [Bryobacteraceae bacterium]